MKYIELYQIIMKKGLFVIFKRYLKIGLCTIFFVTSMSISAFANGDLEENGFSESDYEFEVAKLDSSRLLTEYRLSKYDVINVLVVGFPNGIGVNDIMIGPDGYVQLPYAGIVKLAGLTVPEATDLLKERLGQYIKIPDMSVIVKSYGPRKVYVMGEVNLPGVKELSIDSMDVFSAISNAGGVGKRGRPKHIQLIRTIDDHMYVKEIDLKAYIKDHDITQNIRLLDGDMIYVPDSNKIIFSEDIMPYVSMYGLYRNLTKD